MNEYMKKLIIDDISTRMQDFNQLSMCSVFYPNACYSCKGNHYDIISTHTTNLEYERILYLKAMDTTYVFTYNEDCVNMLKLLGFKYTTKLSLW